MRTKNVWISLIGLILLVAIIITAVIVTRPTNEPVMLTIQAINRDTGKDAEDYWTGSMQTVYYNGDVEYYDEYHQSGKKNKEKWTVEENVLLNTRILLDRIDTFTNESVSGGIEHKITYYDREGNVLLDFYGNIESTTFGRIVYELAK
ncbi:MAG: hypothetical protein IJ419_07930 [Agathobacter sp.]|nr:hypothetical protein [Agathobacter sp.]